MKVTKTQSGLYTMTLDGIIINFKEYTIIDNFELVDLYWDGAYLGCVRGDAYNAFIAEVEQIPVTAAA